MSTLRQAYRFIQEQKFKSYVIREKSQVYDALKHFFGRENTREIS